MIVLLPPSESKRDADSGRPLDITRRPVALREPTEKVLDALIDVCTQDPERARQLLKLSPNQDHLVGLNAHLRQAATRPAWEVYNGVLYDALDFPTLAPTARRRGLSRVLVASALFGWVTLREPIPAYRLSANAGPLPGLASLRSVWSQPLATHLRSLNPSLIVDLRSGAYVSMWPVPAEFAARTVTVKIWQAHSGGERTAVSHHNKAFKGRIVRSLLSAPRQSRTPRALLATMEKAGWTVGLTGSRLDVVIDPQAPDSQSTGTTATASTSTSA